MTESVAKDLPHSQFITRFRCFCIASLFLRSSSLVLCLICSLLFIYIVPVFVVYTFLPSFQDILCHIAVSVQLYLYGIIRTAYGECRVSSV